ncbi:MAG: c-type cytochrome [Chloroflexi bacterium]|nr:c-type cytochrome [Chloroflexota bacterium]
MRGARPGAARTYARVAVVVFLLGVLALLTFSSIQAAPADDGKAVFDQKCKACHTIGGGRLVGPDLKGLTERRDKASAVRFVVAPSGGMPNLGISQQDAENVVAYIEGMSKGATGQAPMAQQASPVQATDDDVERGRQLFTGGVGLGNGGVACASCHNVSGAGLPLGGNLAKDLSTAGSTLGPDGIRSILQTTPFPLMREAYAGHPLTEAEIGYLTAFLQKASSAGQPVQSGMVILYPSLAVAGLIVVMALFQIAWRGRLRGVRQSLVKGGSK